MKNLLTQLVHREKQYGMTFIIKRVALCLSCLIYCAHSKNVDLGYAKAPGFVDRKQPCIKPIQGCLRSSILGSFRASVLSHKFLEEFWHQSPSNRRAQLDSYCINTDQVAQPAVVNFRELSRSKLSQEFMGRSTSPNSHFWSERSIPIVKNNLIFGEPQEKEDIASYNISSPAIHCEPIQNASFSPTICKEEKPTKQFRLMAPVANKATWDLRMSPYAGGEDLLFVTRGIEKAETYMIGKSGIAYAKTAYARFWRLSELISIWLPLNYLAMVTQHEVFGHGYRIRDLSSHNLAKVNGYSFQMPPPYGDGAAATYFSISEHFTTSEASAVSAGGVEGTAILALLTKLKWLSSGRIDPRQSILYLLSEQDLTLYISTLKLKDTVNLEDHDINSYIETLNYTYTDHFISRGRLRSLSWINFIDPFTFYSIYAWFHYLSSGKETKIPMIGSLYLPGLRLGLTPFGPEVFLEHFFSIKKIPLYAYIKGGNHSDNCYLGLGAYAPSFYTLQRWSFGLRGDIWYQPKLLLQPGNVPFEEIPFHRKPNQADPLYPYSEQHEKRFGAAGSLITSFKGNEFCGYEMELGYKSQGFLPGYSLFAYPTIRLSFYWAF